MCEVGGGNVGWVAWGGHGDTLPRWQAPTGHHDASCLRRRREGREGFKPRERPRRPRGQARATPRRAWTPRGNAFLLDFSGGGGGVAVVYHTLSRGGKTQIF